MEEDTFETEIDLENILPVVDPKTTVVDDSFLFNDRIDSTPTETFNSTNITLQIHEKKFGLT